jgi:hypothetical protein
VNSVKSCVALTGLTVLAACLSACGGGGSGNSGLTPATVISTPPTPTPTTVVSSAPTISVLSSRADQVSGGDALVEIALPPDAAASSVQVQAGTTDVTAQFAIRPNGKYQGLLTGLLVGNTDVTARVGNSDPAKATITNFSNGGALLYGPQASPWTCDAGALDAQCNRPVSYSFKYKSSNPALTGFRDYDPATPATDVAATVTDQGKSVPFIIRIEKGVQDRDYFNVAVLFDPTKPWTPWAPQAGWNGKVRFHHGFGMGVGFAQSNTIAASNLLTSEYALGKGFLVADAALNVNTHNANLVVQAESMIMLKEHIVETYGPIRFAFGFGSSGGAIAQYQMANAYPGLYDGIITNASFPDNISTLTEIEDCSLLTNYFTNATVGWADADRAAASGHPSTGVCAQWAPLTAVYNPAPPAGGTCDLPVALRYDALLNPNGGRCSLQDYMVSVMGRSPITGFAYRPYGNVGVQYGLSAVQSGRITPQQFVDLNAKIGAHDIDFVWRPGRVTADSVAVENSYRSGAINEATNLNKVAILDLRPIDLSGIHHQFRVWSTRARLQRANGSSANQVIWFNSGSENEAHDAMDAWLTAVEADKGSNSRSQKLLANKPASLIDRCGALPGTGLTMLECTGSPDGATRMAAGEDITNDNLNCQLKALNRTTYAVTFTDPQWAQLTAAFPAGVCDYSKPGVGQQSTVAWQRYVRPDGTIAVGGEPMPIAPAEALMPEGSRSC